MIRIPWLVLLLISCESPGSSLSAIRDTKPVFLELEGGPVWQSRNDVRNPGSTGTEFSMVDLIGKGAYAAGRITADWDIDQRHSVRGVIAPLEIVGTGSLKRSTSFAGATFTAGLPTHASYKFSSYRLAYRYTFLHQERWRLRAGGTIFVRDAKIELSQGSLQASDSNIGVVPLINFTAEFFPAKKWRIVAEVDGLAAPQGRALDLSIKSHYDLSDWCSLGFGYRAIEGGVDNDEVYNFAWFQSLVVSLGLRF